MQAAQWMRWIRARSIGPKWQRLLHYQYARVGFWCCKCKRMEMKTFFFLISIPFWWSLSSLFLPVSDADSTQSDEILSNRHFYALEVAPSDLNNSFIYCMFFALDCSSYCRTLDPHHFLFLNRHKKKHNEFVFIQPEIINYAANRQNSNQISSFFGRTPIFQAFGRFSIHSFYRSLHWPTDK